MGEVAAPDPRGGGEGWHARSKVETREGVWPRRACSGCAVFAQRRRPRSGRRQGGRLRAPASVRAPQQRSTISITDTPETVELCWSRGMHGGLLAMMTALGGAAVRRSARHVS